MPNLSPEAAHELLRDTINLNLRHAGYERTVSLRDDYRTILTGRGYERFLSRTVRREDEEEFAQRLAMTFQNLSSTAAPLLKKVGQISRVQDIKKGLNFTGTSERDQRDLQDVLNNFGGAGSAQRGSLDDYLTGHYDTLSQADPNAFILLDFAPFQANLGERAKPYAVVFECPSVLNFRYTRGELDFLLVWLPVAYKDPDNVPRVATDYVLYAGTFTLRYYQQADGREDIPPGLDQYQSGVTPAGKVVNVTTPVGNLVYSMATLSPGIDPVPAVRLGDLPDTETGGLTCVSRLLHACVDQFKELINLKSQNDIVSRKHGWPRRYERAPACPGELIDGGLMRAVCDKGTNRSTGQDCKQCGGSGFETHRSEQDTVRMELTGNETAEDLFDLSKLTFTEKPDLATVQAYDEKILAKQSEIYVTAFSTDQQIKVSGPSKTATEYVVSREDQNNTLLPIADYKSFVYKFLVNITTKLMRISGRVESLYEFPRDLKLASLSELYTDLKAARDAGAPDFEIEQILDDIARKRYEADPAALARYFIKKQHVPYFAQTLETFEYFDASNRIPPRLALLRANVDVVFGELEIENPAFYELVYSERDKLVSVKLDQLQAQLPRTVDLSAGIRNLGSLGQQSA